MKKSISIIEVMVSVVLLSIVMMTLLKSRDNNLYFLDKFQTKVRLSNYISLVVTTRKKTEGSIYLDHFYKIKDDKLRKKLKAIKLVLKSDKVDVIDLGNDNFPVEFQITNYTYKMGKTFKFITSISLND